MRASQSRIHPRVSQDPQGPRTLIYPQQLGLGPPITSLGQIAQRLRTAIPAK